MRLFYFLLILILMFSLYGTDPTSPGNGNLYLQDGVGVVPSEIIIYKNRDALTEAGLNFSANRIFPKGYYKKDKQIMDQTEGTDYSTSVDGVEVVLTGNSSWYPHGILGDKNESTGFRVYRDGEVIGEYSLPDDRVFETLRPTIADIVPGNSVYEILLTSSNKTDGSRIEVYSFTGEFLGSSEPIGRGYRWLHLLAVAPFVSSDISSVVVVETPHISGKVKFYNWIGGELINVITLEGFSSHRIGSTNLNMALVSDLDGKKGPELLVPSLDFKSLNIIKVIEGEAKVINSFKLPGRLLTNIYYHHKDNSIWVGCSSGYIVNLRSRY